MKTDIFHMGVERDEYFSSAFFGFAQGLLDHNFSQNLKLQQTYMRRYWMERHQTHHIRASISRLA